MKRQMDQASLGHHQRQDSLIALLELRDEHNHQDSSNNSHNHHQTARLVSSLRLSLLFGKISTVGRGAKRECRKRGTNLIVRGIAKLLDTALHFVINTCHVVFDDV
jgi:hypothetical protein